MPRVRRQRVQIYWKVKSAQQVHTTNALYTSICLKILSRVCCCLLACFLSWPSSQKFKLVNFYWLHYRHTSIHIYWIEPLWQKVCKAWSITQFRELSHFESDTPNTFSFCDLAGHRLPRIPSSRGRLCCFSHSLQFFFVFNYTFLNYYQTLILKHQTQGSSFPTGSGSGSTGHNSCVWFSFPAPPSVSKWWA